MKKVYKSKVARWYVGLFIVMILGLLVSIYLCFTSTWILLINAVFMAICVAMMFDMLLHTDYTIDGDTLHIRCGILCRMAIPVAKITEITHRSSILSSPALSGKRISLRYGRRNRVYISPAAQDDFIASLISLNPSIHVT
ncbi:MAG: PH domain-containing protein [Muribaculaceae bacterium]|nr:PH domain-containing protein [Muribaculaceae bacterium]